MPIVPAPHLTIPPLSAPPQSPIFPAGYRGDVATLYAGAIWRFETGLPIRFAPEDEPVVVLRSQLPADGWYTSQHDRLIELFSSDDPAVLAQACDLLAALGSADPALGAALLLRVPRAHAQVVGRLRGMAAAAAAIRAVLPDGCTVGERAAELDDDDRLLMGARVFGDLRYFADRCTARLRLPLLGSPWTDRVGFDVVPPTSRYSGKATDAAILGHAAPGWSRDSGYFTVRTVDTDQARTPSVTVRLRILPEAHPAPPPLPVLIREEYLPVRARFTTKPRTIAGETIPAGVKGTTLIHVRWQEHSHPAMRHIVTGRIYATVLTPRECDAYRRNEMTLTPLLQPREVVLGMPQAAQVWRQTEGDRRRIATMAELYAAAIERRIGELADGERLEGIRKSTGGTRLPGIVRPGRAERSPTPEGGEEREPPHHEAAVIDHPREGRSIISRDAPSFAIVDKGRAVGISTFIGQSSPTPQFTTAAIHPPRHYGMDDLRALIDDRPVAEIARGVALKYAEDLARSVWEGVTPFVVTDPTLPRWPAGFGAVAESDFRAKYQQEPFPLDSDVDDVDR